MRKVRCVNRRSPLSLVLLVAMLGYTSGAALAAHEAAAHHAHHGEADCPVCHALLSAAFDMPIAGAMPRFDESPHSTTPPQAAARHLASLASARPRGPPAGVAR